MFYRRFPRSLHGRSPRASRRPAPNPFPNFLDRLEDRVTPAFGASGLLSTAAADCDPVAAVSAGPRLASVDASQSALLNGLLTNLTGAGSGLSLSVLDYNALAGGDVNLGTLLGRLQTQLGAGTPEQVLTSNVTLGHIISAAASAAQADGNTALATALNDVLLSVGPLTGTVRLGDLLHVDLPAGSLAQADVNALDLLTGGAQLFNFRNVATTAAPVTISGAALGLPGLVNVQLQAQVVEPPVFVVGAEGTQFYSAAVRVKLNVDLVDTSLDASGLLGPIQTLLGPAASVSATATLGQLQLYADVARGSGTIQAIDAITSAVTIRATPAVADVYLGTIADATFFNRARPIDPAADLTPGTVGSVRVTATAANATVLNVTLGVTARAFAEGAAPLQSAATFHPPYPQSQTVGSSAAAVGNLAASLVTHLQVGLTGATGTPLEPIVGTLQNTVKGVVSTAVQPVLTGLLTGLADPALRDLGVGLGELDLTVYGADVPEPAVAVPDSVITLTGHPVTAFVLANDVIPNDCPRTLAASGAASGTVRVNADQSITYTPDAGFRGADSFTYTLTDEHGRSTSAAVTVFVEPGSGPDGAPVVRPDQVNTQAGVPVAVPVLANDADPDGDPLVTLGVSQPAHGTVAAQPDGTVLYTPAAGFQGTDTFTYSAGDGKGGVGSATVTVTVGAGGPANHAPTVNPDSATATENTPAIMNVLANDTDPDGDPLRLASVGQPLRGTVTVNPDGTLTYTPAAGFVGADRFTYTVIDGKGATGGATVTVSVQRADQSPTIRPDTATDPAGRPIIIPVLTNDTDADGDPLTVAGVTQPEHGTVTVNPDGTITYTPADGFIGTDTFSYTATDGKGGSGSASITVAVRSSSGGGAGGSGTGGTSGAGVNHNPVVNGDGVATQPGVPVTIAVLANDTDADGDPLTVAGVTQPGHGTATVNADGTITYTPAAGFVGTDTFTYTATDGRGGSGSAVVQVAVGNGGRGPVLPELKQFAVGADTTGGPRVTVYNPDGSVRFDFFAYDPSTRFGASVVLADLDGDGVDDIITSPGYGGAPRVRVFSGVDLHVMDDFFAFDNSFRGGCNIAVGDFNGDGVPDLVVGAGKGGGPRVFVIDGKQFNNVDAGGQVAAGARVADFFAFDPSFTGGVSVAVTDLDQNGVNEIVTGAGVGSAPLARVWDVQTQAMTSEFLAFDPDMTSGVNVGGHGEYLVFGAAHGGPPEVRVFRGADHAQISDGMMYEPTFTGGVRVAFGDTVDASRPLFLIGAGVGGGPRIKVLRPDLEVVLPDFFAFEEMFRGGVYVA
jgi:uncharacterized membrane protein